ncbi:HAD hydrolase-like protein [Oscillospiraceae bacterium HV4-5-C5C]|nr:HAD hydrolase-like protein [Oscillospiraceae bacterium HV4-5-C5C]
MYYKDILFDLDGTLTDPEAGITRSVAYALQQLGLASPPPAELCSFIGPPLDEEFQRRFKLDADQTRQAIGFYRERFRSLGIFENELLPGVPELLAQLRSQGCRLSVASSKPEIFVRRILDHFKLSSCFAVVTGSLLDGERRHKADVIAETLRRLARLPEQGAPVSTGAAPAGTAAAAAGVPERQTARAERLRQRAVMVGDRRHDIEGAHACGLKAIGLRLGFAEAGELEAAGADWIAADLPQLSQLLSSL